MTLYETLKSQLVQAMKAHDAVRLSVIRALLTAATNELVATKRKPDEMLPDTDMLAVIKRQANQRKDSIEQFEKGGRSDLAENERAELVILETYLPEMMGEDAIRDIAQKKITELGADKSKMGILIGAVMKEASGQADGAVVKKVVEELLG